MASTDTYLNNNTFGVTPSGTAYFVASDGTTNLGSLALANNCNAGSPASTIPTGSSGIHVDVTIGPYNTYLAGIVGIRTLQANASATAQVGILGIPNQDLTPLAGCGEDMLQSGNSPTPNYNILNPPDYTTINPAYYGYDFILEGSQTPQDSNTTCPAWNGSSSAWKGQVDISGVTGTMVPPMQLPVGTGNSSIDTVIVNACVNLFGASADPNNTTAATSLCYLLVPIANANNPPNEANIVTLGCFKIYDGGSGLQKWRGVLEPINANTCDYGIYQPNWTYGNSFNETQVVMTH